MPAVVSNSSPTRLQYLGTGRPPSWDASVDHDNVYLDASASPFASTSSNSPHTSTGRVSPNPLDLEESRLRSRRNEANSRGRLQEAEQRLRSAIYERGKQIPSSKHRVSQMAADLLMNDCKELAALNKRVSEVTATNSQLNRDNYQLRRTVTDLTEQNRLLQESQHRIISQHSQEKRQLQEEIQQLRGALWQVDPRSNVPSYNQWGTHQTSPQMSNQH